MNINRIILLRRVNSVFISTIMIALVFPAISAAQNLLNLPESIVFDEQNDRYLVSNYQTGDIVQIDMEGNQSYFIRDVDAIQGLEIVDNAVYVGCGYGVRGFDLTTAEMVLDVTVPGVVNLNDVTADTSGNLYVTDVYGHTVVRVKISDGSYYIFDNDEISYPNGILFDAENNRLLMCSFRYNSPIQAISLEDGSVSTVMTTSIHNCDGIARDNFGNYYVTSWVTYAIYRIDSSFSRPPELFYSNSGGPADIAYNGRDDILAIPLMSRNSYDLVPIAPTAIPGEGGEINTLPKQFALNQNFPNPFNPHTTISFELPGVEGLRQQTSLIISDVRGRHVRTLLDEEEGPGRYEIVWDGKDALGWRVSSGIYFYTLSRGELGFTRKMVVFR